MNDAWKSFERKVCRALQDAAGRVPEHELQGITTSTGRVGHLTSLGIDGLVGDRDQGLGLVIEVKRRKMPKWIVDAVLQLSIASGKFKRYPVFAFSLASDLGRKRTVKDDDETFELHKEWAAIPLVYLEELLTIRQHYEEAKNESLR